MLKDKDFENYQGEDEDKDEDFSDPFEPENMPFLEQDLFNNLNRMLEHQSFAFFKSPWLSEDQLQSLDDLFKDTLLNKAKLKPKEQKLNKEMPIKNLSRAPVQDLNLKQMVDDLLDSFFDKKSWTPVNKTSKPLEYSVVWSVESKNGKPTGFMEVNGKRYPLNTLLKKPLTKDKPVFLPLVYFKPRINVTINENRAIISIDARILDEYLKSKNLSVKNLYFSSKYFQGEENKGFLDLAFNSPSLVLRHHLELDENQKAFFKLNPALESLNIDGHLITATYRNEV